MVANAPLWLISIALALGVHAIGIVLIEPYRAALPTPNAFSEELVVVLGEGSGRSVESAHPLPEADSVTRLAVSTDDTVDPLGGGASVPGLGAPAARRQVSVDAVVGALSGGAPEPGVGAPEAGVDVPVSAQTGLPTGDASAPVDEQPGVAQDIRASLRQEVTETEMVRLASPPDAASTESDAEAPRLEPRAAGDVAPAQTAAEALDAVSVTKGAMPAVDSTDEPPKLADVSEAGPEVSAPVAVSVIEAGLTEGRAAAVGSADTSAEPQEVPATVAAITRPGPESTAVVAPAQLVADAEEPETPEDVDLEESQAPEDVDLEESQAPDVVDGEETRAPEASESLAVSSDPVPGDVVEVVSEEVGTEAEPAGLAAVVLEFDTVEAATAPPTREPAAEAADLISIEEQIARALTVDESQSSGLGMGTVARYAGLLKGRLEQSMHYPRAARLAGQQGRVVVRFVIDRNGAVLSIVLEKASGHAILDREAVEMIERAEPFPTMPVEMAGEVLELRVPIAYKIDESSRSRDIAPIYLE